MDTTTNVETKTDPLGTIRRNCRSLRLARDASEEPGQWRINVTAIYPEADEALGAVVITPGLPPAPIWQPEAFEVGIIVGSLVEAGIADTCEALVDTILNGADLDAKHGFRKAPDCLYQVPMRGQEAIVWIS